jgi:hypothetical protein
VAAENLTTYTEKDPHGALTVATTTATWENMPAGGADDSARSWLIKDYGADIFSGDLTHYLDLKDWAADATQGGIHAWLIGENEKSWTTLYADDDDAVTLNMYWSSGQGKWRMQLLKNVDSAFGSQVGTYQWDGTGTVYLTIAISSGTATATMYSDANRTVQMDQAQLALGGTPNCRWISAPHFTSGNTVQVDGQLLNLDLGFGAEETLRKWKDKQICPQYRTSRT